MPTDSGPAEVNSLRRSFFYKRNMRSRWFVDTADDGACDRELYQVANDPTAEDLGCQRLYRESDQVSAGIDQRDQNRQRRARAWSARRHKTRANQREEECHHYVAKNER